MHAMTMTTTVDGHSAARTRERAIGIWLLACCAVLWALVMLGGATRLTESGLSIVDWRPVTGVLPPLDEAAWQAEFDKYRQSPQYLKVNQGMTLGDFQLIFWYEYGHRLLARLLGFVFALPLAWFWLRGAIPTRLKRPLIGVLALGALQGWMGWFMVRSGLVDIPRVSHYRLAAHLSLALAIYACMFWLAVRTLAPAPADAPVRPRAGWWLLALAATTILWGAFVAGLRAGHMFNTFPTMGGHWIPPGLDAFDPSWLNLFENPVAVQFVHRLLALTLFGCVLVMWWRGRRTVDRVLRSAQHGLLAAVLLQVVLGISTLLLHVPVWLGTLHQGGAVLLLSAVLWWLGRGRPGARA
ncbi:MAG: heme A synthase [Lysobacterales bacterium]|nr:Heme A synthase [Xanthomonadales bacterium]